MINKSAPTKHLRIHTLDHSSSEAEWNHAASFCDQVYVKTFGTHWIARPDLLFVTHDADGPVATAGLELGSVRSVIDSERYFQLTDSMRDFISMHRNVIAEFGRFTCKPRAAIQGARSVLHAALTYCKRNGIQYLFAWTRPEIATHGAQRLGVPFWILDIPLNEDTIRSCTNWKMPPTKFFFGKSTPQLLLVAIIPFFDYVIDTLAESLAEVLRDDKIESNIEAGTTGKNAAVLVS